MLTVNNAMKTVNNTKIYRFLCISLLNSRETSPNKRKSCVKLKNLKDRPAKYFNISANISHFVHQVNVLVSFETFIDKHTFTFILFHLIPS